MLKDALYPTEMLEERHSEQKWRYSNSSTRYGLR
jgi:hypothetical protein